MFSWLKRMLGIGRPKPTLRQVTDADWIRFTAKKQAVLRATEELDGMDEGDYHSGIHGYSPNTAYPQAPYGYDRDLDWHEGDES